jgi:hypothetical protein
MLAEVIALLRFQVHFSPSLSSWAHVVWCFNLCNAGDFSLSCVKRDYFNDRCVMFMMVIILDIRGNYIIIAELWYVRNLYL